MIYKISFLQEAWLPWHSLNSEINHVINAFTWVKHAFSHSVVKSGYILSQIRLSLFLSSLWKTLYTHFSYCFFPLFFLPYFSFTACSTFANPSFPLKVSWLWGSHISVRSQTRIKHTFEMFLKVLLYCSWLGWEKDVVNVE